jgi:hypothetical protein
MYDGVGKGLFYIFGQAGPSALFGVFVPFWFIEGDAVFNETIHSKSGRGRYPLFWMDLKAQVIDKKIYKYDKASLGSFKDYVPDHYTLGYQLVLHGALNYTYKMWNLALERVARRPYILKPFVNGMRIHSGMRKVKYYNHVIDSLQKVWKNEHKYKKITKIHYLKIYNKTKLFTSYRYPTLLTNGSIIAERNSIDDINRFVIILPDGTEKILFTPGFDYAESLSANDSLICWNEKRYDIRWSNRDFSIIKIYNFKTKKLKVISHKSCYFAPSLSPDASRIVVSSVSPEGINSLNIFDISSGKILQTFTTDSNYYFTTPLWSSDGKTITTTIIGDKGKTILLYHPESNKADLLLPFSHIDISRPYKSGDNVYFTGTWHGENDLYELNITTGNIFRILISEYGAFDAVVTNNKLLFSNYTADGYKIATANLNILQKEKTDIKKTFIYPIDKLVKRNTFVLEDTIVPEAKFTDKKYTKAGHIFNIHSWGPFLIDVNNYNFIPNAVIMSQNILGTAVSTLGYYYNTNEQRGKVKFTFDYTGLFTVLGFEANYGKRHETYIDSTGISHSINWQETDIAFNTYIPFKFIKSKWIKGFTPSISVGEKLLKMSKGSEFSFNEDHFTILSYSLYGYNKLKRSRLDLYSKWSQSIVTLYKHTPFSDKPGYVALVAGIFTFPGIIKHQGIKIYAGKQWMLEGNYPFSNYIRTPRGYSNLSFTNMTSLQSDYAFPIAYPDWDIPSAFYLTRIYAHVFYDYAYFLNSYSVYENISSCGAELYTDWYFLSLPVQITLGIRVSYTFKSTFVPEFLFGFGI